MLPTDRRSEWDDHLLNDPRVTHLWNEDKVSFFDGSARWSDAPTKLLGSGRTVIAHSDDLDREISPFLSQ